MNQSMNKAQLNQLLLQVRAGSEEAFLEVLRQYEPLVGSMVNTYSDEGMAKEDREDMRQEAILALYHAMLDYDSEQDDVQFGLYAKICIKNALISKRRKDKRLEEQQLQEDVLIDAVGESYDPEAHLLERERLMRLDQKIRSCLSPLELQIWNAYCYGKTAREIGEEMGRNEKSVQNAIFRIRRKLRASIK